MTQADRMRPDSIIDIVQRLKRKSVRELLSGVSINRECDIPYIAGCSDDMRTVYIDRGVPRTILDKNGARRSIDVFLAIHEIVETTILKALGVDYLVGHDIAIEFEKKAVEKAGIDWQEYDLLMRAEYIRTAAQDPVDAPFDLYLKPYIDSNDDEHLELMLAATQVDRTKPGSKNDWRITYSTGSQKWTDDRPGDGVGESGGAMLKETLKDPAVQRGLNAVSDAIESGKGLETAVKAMVRDVGEDKAKTLLSALQKHAKKADAPKKVIEGIENARKMVASPQFAPCPRYTCPECGGVQNVRCPGPRYDVERVCHLCREGIPVNHSDRLGESIRRSMNKQAAVKDRLPKEIPTLWYENEAGDRFYPDMSQGMPEVPEGFIYQRSLDTSLTDSVLKIVQADEVANCDHDPEYRVRDHGWIDSMEGERCQKCGGHYVRDKGSTEENWEASGSINLIGGSSGWSEDLAMAMANSGIGLKDAIVIAATACERCMNSLAYEFGLDWGYEEGSQEWMECGTECDFCKDMGYTGQDRLNLNQFAKISRVAGRVAADWGRAFRQDYKEPEPMGGADLQKVKSVKLVKNPERRTWWMVYDRRGDLLGQVRTKVGGGQFYKVGDSKVEKYAGEQGSDRDPDHAYAILALLEEVG